MARRSDWIAAALVYLLYGIAILAPMWLVRVSPIWDARDFNYPAFAYAADALRSGRLPLWDPYSNCGMPFHADPQYAWYQPVAAILALARHSALSAYMIFWAGTWLWAGLGALFFAASLGAGPAGGLVAAIVFSMSGFFVGHGEHLPFVVTGCWIPWVFALAQRAVARASWPSAVLAGVALGLSALGGYAGLVVFEVLALATWMALSATVGLRSATNEARGPVLCKRILRTAAVLALCLVLLVVIWSPGLYSFMIEARDYTDRTKPLAPELALFGNPFSLHATLTFLFPRLVVIQERYFPADVTMNDAYLGALALPFAAVWLVKRGKGAWWFVAFVGFWFIVSLGGHAILRTLLHYAIPPTRYMRHNAMLRVLFLAPLAAAAGAGVTDVLSDVGTRARALWILLGWLILAIFASIYVAAAFPLPRRDLAPVALPVLLASGAGLSVLHLVSPRRHRWNAALLVLLFGVDLAWHLHSNSFTVWRRDPSFASVELLPRDRDPAGERTNDPAMRWTNLQQVTHTPVVEGFVALRSAFNEMLVRSRFESVLRTQRFWLSPSSWLTPPAADGLQVLAAHGLPGPVPVFVDRPADILRGDPVEPGAFGRVSVVSYLPERVELETDVPPSQGAILASTERYSPSWRVTVDKVDRPLARVNYYFRGVRVAPGRHRIVFEYRPRAFVALLLLSYGTILASLALAILLWWKDRKAGWPGSSDVAASILRRPLLPPSTSASPTGSTTS